MLLPRLVAAALICVTAAAARADPPPTFRGGEWQARVGIGAPLDDNTRAKLICHRTDEVVNAATVARLMGQARGSCARVDLRTHGKATGFAMTCTLAGGQMTASGTLTADGPEAFSIRGRMHLDSQSLKLPDVAITNESRRLGPCRPGDADGL